MHKKTHEVSTEGSLTLTKRKSNSTVLVMKSCFNYESAAVRQICLPYNGKDEFGVLNNKQSVRSIQNRAIRYYQVVHKFAPNLSITGDMG